jgi:hypothetical protein
MLEAKARVVKKFRLIYTLSFCKSDFARGAEFSVYQGGLDVR